MGPIGSGNSYFNKNGGPMGSSGGGLPSLNSKGGVASNGAYGGGVGFNKNSAIGGNRTKMPGLPHVG